MTDIATEALTIASPLAGLAKLFGDHNASGISRAVSNLTNVTFWLRVFTFIIGCYLIIEAMVFLAAQSKTVQNTVGVVAKAV